MAEIAEKVKVSTTGQSADGEDEEDDCRLCEYFPTFVWAVRDFTLELSADGKALSADEYLENALSLKKGLHHFQYNFCQQLLVKRALCLCLVYRA